MKNLKVFKFKCDVSTFVVVTVISFLTLIPFRFYQNSFRHNDFIGVF